MMIFRNIMSISLLFLVIIIPWPCVTPLSFNFKSFTPNSLITYNFSANVAENAIQLTRNVRESSARDSKIGRATYAQPMYLWDSSSRNLTDFQTHFSFSISSLNQTSPGGGLAFFLIPNGSSIEGNVSSGTLGLTSDSDAWNLTRNPFVAVEFGTSPRSGDPPNGQHVGIDINSMRSVSTKSWWCGPCGNTSNKGNEHHVWISYESASTNLSVVFTSFKDDIWFNNSLSYLVDLRDYLPEFVYFGFSAATEDFSAEHAIHAWSFSSNLALPTVHAAVLQEALPPYSYFRSLASLQIYFGPIGSPEQSPSDQSGSPPPPETPADQLDSPPPPKPTDTSSPPSDSSNPPVPVLTKKKKKVTIRLAIALPTAVGVALVFVIAIGIITGWFKQFCKKKRSAKERDDEEVGNDAAPSGLKKATGDVNNSNLMVKEDSSSLYKGSEFAYDDLKKATADFSSSNLMDKDDSSSLYKGILNKKGPGRLIAVKRISSHVRGIDEYVAEVQKMKSTLNHKNLVRVLGWCYDEKRPELLVVYEYMPNGSLYSSLFGNKASSLTWATRLNIIEGLAEALRYLHESCNHCVIHRDVRSSNVMLDENHNARLGDFEFARLLEHGRESKTTADWAGKWGYVAPEYSKTNVASTKTDVFSFGVVVLEIVTGRNAIHDDGQGTGVNLVDWVWSLYEMGKPLDAADPGVCSFKVQQEMERVMTIGLWCAHPLSVSRPSIGQVIRILEDKAQLPHLPSRVHGTHTANYNH